jgi:hypothetical protein
MITDFVRDTAGTAAVFGFFASAWFGWAQERPPPRWRPFLIAGAVTSLVTAAVGGLLTWRLWREGTAYDEDTSPIFGIVVGIEFAVAAAGAVLLAVRRRKELTTPWIALVVGLHLFPVAALVEYPFLYVVAAAVTVVSLVAVPLARSRSVAVSAVTGLLTGTVLLVGALVSLTAAVLRA